MNWNDYEAIWKRQPLPVGETADLAELRATFETKRRKMAATLLVRDLIELLACAFVLWMQIRYWKKIGPTGWPMSIAILMVLFVAVVFIRERLRARRSRLGADASLRAKVEADLAELRHQRHLLLRVWVWYLAPCVVAILIRKSVSLSHARERDPSSFVIFVILTAALCWWVWALNRRAVRKRIEPRIAELEKLHRDLLDNTGGEAPPPVLPHR
jgi:hypothetical protein